VGGGLEPLGPIGVFAYGRVLACHTKPAFCTAIHSFVTSAPRHFKFGVYTFIIASPTLTIKNLPWMGRSQGHVSNFGPRKFHHSKSSEYWCDQQTRRRSACGLHLRQSSASWLNEQVCYTLVDCNPLTPLLRFVLDLYKLFLHCCAEDFG